MSDSNRNTLADRAKRPAEMTIAALVLGVILSLVMGAANVYLGLRAGMTVSASIPAAVVAMGVLHGVLRRRSMLESNLVQTAASAGESIAGGIIFTMPALVLTGIWQGFDYWTTTLIALSGGLLGILLMIPMRRVFVVENTELQYPEGLACAEVLRAGEGELEEDADNGSAGFFLVVGGILVGGVFKFAQSFVGLFRGTAEWAVERWSRVFFVGADISPALLSVGYIVTFPIAIQIFAGGAIGWLIAIPLIGTQEVEPDTAVNMADAIWRTKVRYMGVGAMIVGGIQSIWQVRGGLWAAILELVSIMSGKRGAASVESTERNLGGGVILWLTIVSVALIGAVYYSLLERQLGLTVLTTTIMLVMSFFFAAVASYIVGLVGNSNSPVSGMTISAVLVTGLLMTLFGFGGSAGIIATLGVAGIVCCVACTSGDVCNDLKTGYLLGASPRLQQIMQVIGVVVASFIMAPVLTILHEGSLKNGTGGIGGSELPAPQAGLFSELAKGFFDQAGSLPQAMVTWGIVIGVLLIVGDWILQKGGSQYRLYVMPVAVGIYLPFGLSVPIFLGGLLRGLVNRRDPPGTEKCAQRGVLMTSGVIAGESIIGVILGFVAYMEWKSHQFANWLVNTLSIPEVAQEHVVKCVSLAALVAVAAWIYFKSIRSRLA